MVSSLVTSQGCKPPSREAYLSFLSLLAERNRFKAHYSFAESLVRCGEGLATDVEVVAMAMLVCCATAQFAAVKGWRT